MPETKTSTPKMSPTPPTVRNVIHALMDFHGLDLVFGNPGSNELPFLKGLPARYILGLQESAVLGMADGYAQVTRRPTLVNLHAASGTGNAMGALTNAAVAHSKLVITAGQQVRSMVGLDAMLANTNATLLPQPLVTFSAEPLCAQDTPRAFSNAIFAAEQGPSYLSIPYDDWDQPADANTLSQLKRTVRDAQEPHQDMVSALQQQIEHAQKVAFVVGPDIDDGETWLPLISLAEAYNVQVWGAPSLSRLAFPNQHILFQGILPAGIDSIGQRLSQYDLVIVFGAPVFRYHQWEPGLYLDPSTELLHITTDSNATARAPLGDALLADPSQVIKALARSARTPVPSAVSRWRNIPRAQVSTKANTLHPEEVFAVLRETVPERTRFVVESTSTNTAFWTQMDLRHPGSYFFPASGGLGWGLPASLGVALADESRAVVALIGDGSAHYSLSALYTAVHENIPVVVVILRNNAYGALNWFATLLGVPDAPGLELGTVDFVSIAHGYGMNAVHASSAAELREHLLRALQHGTEHWGPTLIEVDTLVTTPEPTHN